MPPPPRLNETVIYKPTWGHVDLARILLHSQLSTSSADMKKYFSKPLRLLGNLTLMQ